MHDEPSAKNRRPITTSEIARLCNVSRTTVSAVLNGKRNVRESTRSRILECVRQHNYESGMISRSLVCELSHMVAVLATDLSNPFSLSVFRGIDDVLGGQGYHILFHKVRQGQDPDMEMLASLQSCRPAGYVVLKGAEGRDGAHIGRISEMGVPVVALGRMEGGEYHCVQYENRNTIGMSTDYVIECGHRRIGHLAGPPRTRGANERQLGFVESLITHNLRVSDSIIVDAGEMAAEGYQAAIEVLKDPAKRPTALVCFNDMIALGAYRAAHELSLDIPGDVSITGFDNLDFTELLGPPLTTIDIHPWLLGRKMAELLLKVIGAPNGHEKIVEWVEPELVVRQSVRRI